MLTTNHSAWRTLCGAGAALVLCATGLVGQAAPQVCSLTKFVECDETMGCVETSPTGNGPAPTFLRVDRSGGAITILAPEERRGETTEIRHAIDVDGTSILTGTVGERGWSMSIVEQDGAMTMTITDSHVGFVVFGRCMAADRVGGG